MEGSITSPTDWQIGTLKLCDGVVQLRHRFELVDERAASSRIASGRLSSHD
jgi:hypothetical protein